MNSGSFDPIAFFNLHLDDKAKKVVTEELLDSLSQYIIVRTVEMMPAGKLDNIDNPEELFELAKKEFPVFDNQIKKFLEDFQREYQRTTGVI